ncbi:hypothetical protein NIES2109_63020 (plasmid) [Nostoc sp. HK-01]|nr:hypothetical protein NIES2109_63020 [Nostoc sp. HK-01]
MTTRKKMSGMKLSQFSGIKSQTEPEITEFPTEVEPASPVLEKMPVTSSTKESVLSAPTASLTSEPLVQEKPVTINIKITRAQHNWLTDTARTVRDNNTEAVPPGERVYPQHLIGVAIELLQNSEVDWSQVKNTEDLKRLLNL